MCVIACMCVVRKIICLVLQDNNNITLTEEVYIVDTITYYAKMEKYKFLYI